MTAVIITTFLSIKVEELQHFLRRERSVPVADEVHAELAERDLWAQNLGLAVKQRIK